MSFSKFSLGATPPAPRPHNRRQGSLEDVLDFSGVAEQPPLKAAERENAQQTFSRIVKHIEDDDPFDMNSTFARAGKTYSQPRLILGTYENALTVDSKDIFLRSFFYALELDISAPSPNLNFAELKPLFAGFAEYLLDNFFLPLIASGRKTPQPSPAVHSAVLRAQNSDWASQDFTGTPERLSALRGLCLERDRHRCVISDRFDANEFEKRYNIHGPQARDDDGTLFSAQQTTYRTLEVAHILPHSLMKTNAGAEMDESRKAALAILNMFDKNVTHYIKGVDIDRPRNALTLTQQLHEHFGAFKIYFEPFPEAGPDVYKVGSYLPPPMNPSLGLPTTRTFRATESRTIDPPSARLLAVHRAIAKILHMSAAGHYINRLLRDMEDSVVRADGTTELGRIVGLGLRGWLDGMAYG